MKKVVLKNVKFVENTFEDGSKQFVGLARGDSFYNVDIPLEPNPRQFLGYENTNYGKMKRTLLTEPEMFARKNSAGITIFASGCDANGDGSYTLTFNDDEGIANGGHTYHSLKHHGTAKSFVKVTVEVGLNKEKAGEISEALNLSKRIQTHSLHNKRGIYDWHKEELGPRYAKDIIYFEGDEGLVTVMESLSLLRLFHTDTSQRNRHIESKYSFKHRNSSTNKDSDFVKATRWIAKDVHELHKYLITNKMFIKETRNYNKIGRRWLRKLPNGEYGINKALAMFTLYGLASVAVEVNKNGIIQWKKDFRSYEQRVFFLDILFTKIMDTLSLEEGTMVTIARSERVMGNIAKQSMFVANIVQKEVFKQNALDL